MLVTGRETEVQRLEATGLTQGHAKTWGQSLDGNVGLFLVPVLTWAVPPMELAWLPRPLLHLV